MNWRAIQLWTAMGAVMISGTTLVAACDEAGAETTAPPPDHTHPLPEHAHDCECHAAYAPPIDCLWDCGQDQASCVYDAPVCPPVSSVCHKRRALALGDCLDDASECEARCWGSGAGGSG